MNYIFWIKAFSKLKGWHSPAYFCVISYRNRQERRKYTDRIVTRQEN